MNRKPHRLPRVLTILVAASLCLAFAPAAHAAKLTGTFKIAPGKSVQKNGKWAAKGSYFKMIYPNGNARKGPFFKNSNSKARNKQFTLFTPGIDGGLRTGSFQEQPTPAFAPNGFALANRIVRPLLFAGIKFSLSTAPVDAQSGAKVGVPAITANGSKLTGELRGFTASWNKIYFNQGAPKPGGNFAGKTRRATGTYDARTKRYSITWVSQIVGGPFNDFAGYWHLEGTFKPAAGG